MTGGGPDTTHCIVCSRVNADTVQGGQLKCRECRSDPALALPGANVLDASQVRWEAMSGEDEDALRATVWILGGAFHLNAVRVHMEPTNGKCAHCQNCTWNDIPGKGIIPVPDIHERVGPNEPMPVCGCPECGAVAHLCTYSLQTPTKDPHDRYGDLQKLYEGCYETVEVPGHQGQWVLFLFPHAE